MKSDLDHVVGLCESPIEEALLRALVTHLMWDGIGVVFREESLHERTNDSERLYLGKPWAVIPQVSIGRYRVDFLVKRRGYAPGLVIEADGKEFHRDNPERGYHDYERDRWFRGRGYDVMRFSGARIAADADGVAAEVHRFVCHPMTRQEQEEARWERFRSRFGPKADDGESAEFPAADEGYTWTSL